MAKKKKNDLCTLLVIGVIILIVVLAVMAGVKEGKKVANTGASEYTPNPSKESGINNATPKATAKASPTANPTETPKEPQKVLDTSNMTSEEKENYAKAIAKEKWEKVGANIEVIYEYETVLDDGTYMIRIVNNATTIDWCYVDIITGTAELETYK